MSATRVLLHVGTPKTGTTHLQDVLFRNRELLATHDIHYLADRHDAHFLAALDLMQLTWGGLQIEAVGAWDRLAKDVRRAGGTAIISHEILAHASKAHVARALESLGHGDGTEIHLVLSARDLARQIPAEWQENVKHRSTSSYAKFLKLIQDPDRSGRIASWFWAVQELPDILDRWGHDLPPEHVHVVTVPTTLEEPDLLWNRFARVLGLDGLGLELHAERANPSLGVPETALVRRINRSVNKVLPPADYRPLVRELLAHQTLSARTKSPRLALPPAVYPWVEELSASWVAELGRRGYDVVGDLDELMPGPPVASYTDPDAPRERQVAQAALDAIKALLLDNARLRHEQDRLEHELQVANSALGRAHLLPSYQLRQKLVRRLEAAGVGRALLAGYRRARGRSSRSA